MHLKPQLLRGLALGAVLLGVAAPHTQAQTPDRKTALSANIGLLQYHGNMGSDFWNRSGVDLEVGGGGAISRYLSPSWDAALLGYYETYKFSSQVRAGDNFEARVGMVDLGFKLKLNNGKILKEESRIQPYLMAGPGMFLSNTSGRANGKDFGVTQIRRPELFGLAGIRIRLSDVVSLDLTTSQHYPLTERVDNLYGSPDDKLYDRFLLHQAGITVALGQAKDEDGDGVSDKKDKCPGTPKGVAVDPNGCPLDKDGDGVPDYQDKCPDVKGVAALQGCPDRDGDGVTDADDKCPDTPGKAELQGCPDADNDGVIDQNDKCPDTPAGVKVDANGCPLDRDGDGVPDYQDRCPDRAGPASNKGCPEVKAETKKRLKEATKFINFEFNKAVLLPSSYPTLKDLAAIMAEYPDYTMSISGHTDSKGSDDYNLRLSYDRAASARAYMLSQGVPTDRIESRGYGETKPIADNATKAGQALNRRVEFDLYLTGDPNAAEVKYGPAPTISELQKTPAGRPTAGKAPVKKAPAKKAPAKKAPVKRK
ncbi:OmpA family protein [Hymenobacter sp. BT770]|uniref:OmpA family protein n=1 Tax=Hymenobacter sp. BT770 TaxID=2886942 RepID=UPI002673C690|nr:OmpA family protein [Hymenobacter sp. BT770]MDO3413873.1 OmpA family protein [Hymenobacter sp. BT770]